MPDYPRGFVGLRGEPLSRGGSSLGHADPSGECYRLIDMADSWLLTFRSLWSISRCSLTTCSTTRNGDGFSCIKFSFKYMEININRVISYIVHREQTKLFHFFVWKTQEESSNFVIKIHSENRGNCAIEIAFWFIPISLLVIEI